MDSGQALDSGMSAIYYAFLSSLHASVPERILYPLSITALTTTNWSADSLLQNTGNTQPAFHAHSSAPVTIGTQIAFNTVDRDNTVSYSFVSGTYTVPVTGWYHFDAYVQIINTTGSTQNINIILNANSQAIGSSSVPSLLTATGQAVSVSGTYYMTAGQSVYIQTAALSANYTAQGHFSGYLIF
jgi:hypothetical protein